MADLSQYDNAFDAALVDDNHREIPDGTYQVLVNKVEILESKNTGKPYFKWKLKVIGPNYIGKVIFTNNQFQPDTSLAYLKKNLKIAGLDCKPSELQDRMWQLLDVALQIRVKNKKSADRDTLAVYFDKRIQLEDAVATHDIPF